MAYITESIWTYFIFIGYYEIQKELRVKLLRNNFTEENSVFMRILERAILLRVAVKTLQRLAI